MGFDFSKEPGKVLRDRGLSRDGMPLVSIVTPFYNSGAHFEQTYNCVLGQTFPWFEWIIVDDGSTDGDSLALLERLAGADPRIRVLHKENGGIATARNMGIRSAASQIVIPLDADDLIAPTYTEVLYWALRCHPECAWAYTDTVGFGTQEYMWRKNFSALRMREENILVCTAAIRKSALEAVGCYPELSKHFNEDWYTWLKMLARGMYPVHTAVPDGFWYRRGDSGVLSIVKNDGEYRRKNQEFIREAAREVTAEVPAVEYPRGAATGGFHAPKASGWTRPAFAAHDRTRVLMLLPWLEMGGADLFNLDVCARLDKSRFDVGIITTQPGENTWQDRFADHVTDIFHLWQFLDVKDWAEFVHYYIASREVDVLFVSNSYFGFYLVPWLRREFPDLAIIDYVHMEEWYWRSGGYARLSTAMSDVVEKTYVCNERTRRVFLKDFGRAPESVETLYIGVDDEKFDAAAVAPGLAREQLGIAPQRPIVLFPCRIHPQKRPFLMLAVAEALRRKMPDVAFVVVGDGPQWEELKIAAGQRELTDTVYFAGRQSDMRPWYRDAAVTLICSLKEGLALTAYESLSMSTPVVTSDVGGQAELVDAAVGRVVPLLQDEEKDLDSRDFSGEEIALYVDAVTELLADPAAYEAACAACRRRIEEGFSTRRMIEKLSAVLEDLRTDPARRERRRQCAAELAHYPHLTGELVAVMGEIQAYEDMWKNSHPAETKDELMRMANSKWGRRLIRLIFKLRLNRLFR